MPTSLRGLQLKSEDPTVVLPLHEVRKGFQVRHGGAESREGRLPAMNLRSGVVVLNLSSKSVGHVGDGDGDEDVETAVGWRSSRDVN